MFIQPGSVIKVLHNCPLDNTYENTIYFANKITQANYFTSLAKYTRTAQTYQRLQKTEMTVEILADDIYDCNYVMFQNTPFGSKWFYAFITGVEYVNNTTSKITFEIDVMQTWFFEHTVKQCFVEREHSATDNIGDNLIEENFELGEYISDDIIGTGLGSDLSIVVACPFNEEYQDTAGGMYANLFSGLNFVTFPNTPQGALDCIEFIDGSGQKASSIVSIFIMPTAFITDNLEPVTYQDIVKSKTYNLIKRTNGSSPKNKKLFTYPYNFLYVSNMQGNSAVYPYEYFQSPDSCTFIVAGDMSCNPSMVLAPTMYKGCTINFDEKLTIQGYPQLAYSTNTFESYVAQQASQLATSSLSNAFLASRATGAVGGAVAGLGTAIVGSNKIKSAQITQNLLGMVNPSYQMPRQSYGSVGTSLLTSINLMDFKFMEKYIRPEFVDIIDDYFNMYGYATRRVKVPNFTSRPYWNYVKTVGSIITGSVPVDDMKKLHDIYDTGVTFWHNGANIGNYSLDNRPIVRGLKNAEKEK